MKSFSREAVGLTAGVGLLLALTGVAHADNFIADGDDLSPATSLAMGEVCATTGSDGYNGGNDQPVSLVLERSGNATNNPETVWGNNTAVGLSHSETHAAIGVTMPTLSSITTPSNWTTSAGGTLSDEAEASVRVQTTTLGVLGGTGPQRKITFTAAGLAHDGSTNLSKSKDVEVTATIVNDASALVMDCKLPTASITTPASGTPEYEQGSTQNADYSCADPVGTNVAASGIMTCAGIVTKPDATTVAVADDAALPTADFGTYTLTVTPTDNAGNVGAAVIATYEVIAPSSAAITFDGFFSPVDSYNVVKAGQGVALKWVTKDGGTVVADDAASHGVASIRYSTAA